MELISRVDNDSDGVLEVDWQLSADLYRAVDCPLQFFPDRRVGRGCTKGGSRHWTDMDLATGEGGVEERAIGFELIIDGTTMDRVLYGRHDGSNTGRRNSCGRYSF